MKHKDLTNKAQEDEILSADDRKLRELLGGLKKVDAPKDFDFRLKARIANAKPQDFQKTQLFPILRYVLPLSVVILLVTFVALNISFSPQNENAPQQIAENNFQPPKAEIPNSPAEIPAPVPSEAPFVASIEPEKPSEIKTVPPVAVNLPKKSTAAKPILIAAKETKQEAVKNVEPDAGEAFAGTKDEASKPPTVIVLNNSNSNPVVAPPPNADPNNKISLKDILAQIGIEADFTGAKCKIVSLKESSPALRSGMKVGDLIEAIDDKKLSSETEFLKTASGKVFQILRDGKQILIELNLK
jgi:hypothetical protein